MDPGEQYDLIVIGSGPAGQKAAIQGAKAGRRVVLVESSNRLGGACVHRGTIPSKVLHENATQLAKIRRDVASFGGKFDDRTPMTVLTRRLQRVLDQHHEMARDQLDRNGIELIHGRAVLQGEGLVEVSTIRRELLLLAAPTIILATGSSPRDPQHIPIDHQNILDSDSILSLVYLPDSLIVVGSGVIACEYASIFACLGSRVTMVDRFERPLGFLDVELTSRFLEAFENMGGKFVGNTQIRELTIGPLGEVTVELDQGQSVSADKMMVAAGRKPNIDDLGLETVGIQTNPHGVITVDEHGLTTAPGIYAVGDIIGAPALASAAMEQGRRAARHALGLPPGNPPSNIPSGIFTIPEIAAVGLSEDQVRERHGTAIVGLAPFEELSRTIIDGADGGLLKLIADGEGIVQGVQIVGEASTELVHLGLMAIVNHCHAQIFVSTVFNYPTQAEAYRVAALSILGQCELKCNHQANIDGVLASGNGHLDRSIPALVVGVL